LLATASVPALGRPAPGSAFVQSGTSSGSQAVAKPQEEALPLEADKPIELKFAGAGSHRYRFDLTQGQYTAVLVDCPELIATTRLLDSAGDAINETYGDNKSTKETVEVAAEKSGRYQLDIESKAAQAAGKVCTIHLEPPRAASEKEILLQQARTMVVQARDLMLKGKRDEAADFARKALEVRERLLGPEDASVVYPLTVLARVPMAKADYQTAEALLSRALKVQEKAGNPANGRAFSILNELAIVYLNMDQFDKAEPLLLRAIDIAENVYGPEQPAVVNPLINLANLYDEKGDYSRAQALFERAATVVEKVYGPDYSVLGVILANLAGVYSERGDYVNGVRFGQRAVAIFEKAGRSDRQYAIALVNLGDAYRFRGELDTAEPIYEHALKVYEKTAGPENPLVADNLGFLADIYRERHDFAKAEEFYQRSLDIREKKLGESHTSVAQSLDDLGSLYCDQGNYARAEPLLQRALAIRAKALGPEHPEVAVTLTHLSVLEMATGDFAKAESFLSQAIAISQHNADLNLLAGSEREKLAYLELWSSQLDRAITLHAGLAPEQGAARDLAITTVLQRKGRVRDVLADNLKVLHQHLSKDDAKVLDNFDSVTSQLARLVLRGSPHTASEEQEKQVNALREEREQLEAEISRRSGQFRVAPQSVTLEAVRSALPEDGALVEFVNYHRLPKGLKGDKNAAGESRYIAYVVRSHGDVQWKELGPAADLDRTIDAYRQALREPGKSDAKQAARGLDEKILQPLRASLGDATHLLISPDGQLSLIPFEALLDQQNRYAVQRYSITYLSTGRDLLRKPLMPASSRPAIVIADPSFGEPVATQVAALHRPRLRDRRRSVTTATDLSSVYFAPLDGTAQEARSIHLLFTDAVVLTGTHASVAALKQVEAPSIFHIATHGFFLADPYQQASSEVLRSGTRGTGGNLQLEDPLLRSGLALAGANLDKTGKDSGILTALEASNLNLWGTKLVTLSACDTGVGEVKNGEGVYGLRRSFFLAGAETLVMSLWPVSDYVTREMMTSYYSGLKHGLGRGEALRQAQVTMLKRKGREHPFYWASFIQSGEWANLDGQR